MKWAVTVAVFLVSMMVSVAWAAVQPSATDVSIANRCRAEVIRPAELLCHDLRAALEHSRAKDGEKESVDWTALIDRADAIDETAWQLLLDARENWFTSESPEAFTAYVAAVDALLAADYACMVPRIGEKRELASSGDHARRSVLTLQPLEIAHWRDNARKAVAQWQQQSPAPLGSAGAPTPVPIILGGRAGLRRAVQELLAGKANTGRPRLRGMDVVEQIDGGYGVFVQFNANDNLTANMRKGGLEMDMSEVYMVLYRGGYDVRVASVAAYFPLVDQYGHESDGLVYKSILRKATADRVNWSAPRATLGLRILPAVWTTSFRHQDFR